MPETKTRMAGSGRTAFFFNGFQIAWLDSFTDSGQAPVGAEGGMEVVHPIGKRHPQEIVTSRALSAGTLTVSVRELWNSKWWHQFRGLAGTQDVVAVWQKIAARKNSLTAAIVIRRGGKVLRGRQFHGVMPQPFDDGETGGPITLGSLTIARNMTFTYLKRTNLGAGPTGSGNAAARMSADDDSSGDVNADWTPDPDDPENNAAV
jgi:hypothetical protein